MTYAALGGGGGVKCKQTNGLWRADIVIDSRLDNHYTINSITNYRRDIAQWIYVVLILN